MSTAINWSVPKNSPVLNHPTYLLFSSQTFNDMDANQIKNAIKAALASNESADLVSYLSWCARVKALVS